MADPIKTTKPIINHFFPVVCSVCHGAGCGNCGNQPIVYWYTARNPEQPFVRTLVWRAPVDWPHIVQRSIERGVRKVIGVKLWVLGGVGVALAVWAFLAILDRGYGFVFSLYPFKLHWSGGGALLVDWRFGLFLISVLIDLYAFARRDRILARQQQVITRPTATAAEESSGEPPMPPAWSVLMADVKSQLDISRVYTPGALAVVEQAWRIAKNWRQPEILPIHLLAALFGAPETSIIFSRLGADWDKLAAGVKESLATIPPQTNEPQLSLAVRQALFLAYAAAWQERQLKVGVGELLVALTMEQNTATEALYRVNVDADKISNVVVWLQTNEKMRANWQQHHSLGRLRPKGDVNKAFTAVETRLLDAFSTDLTRQATWGQFPPQIGRETEMANLFRVLEGGQRGIVLVGLPGVGKTAFLEDLAQRMIADDVPKPLQDRRLVSLSVAKLTSGANPADINQRLWRMFEEISVAGNIVLVIENVHELIGISSGSEESLDLSEALATYMSKTAVPVIATTTPMDWEAIQSAGNIAGLLHTIELPEPVGNQAIQMVEAQAVLIENQSRVFFSYDAIANAVALSSRYIHERYLPAKALDILRETAAQVAGQRGKDSLVSAEDVAVVVSSNTKIPLTKISEAEGEKLVNLESEIHRRMIGQEEPVREVAAALRRARAGVREGHRPIANFLFLGPTGVGKTELAKTIAEVYFGSEDNMIRLDMSEYQTKESIYRLIGAPGDKTGGIFTQAVRRQPFALLLLDEIEKAHPDILNVFLQVMDDGRITDSSGRTVDCTSTILIMTSNAGTSYIQQQLSTGASLEQIKRQLLEQKLGEYFRPEFLNRFDSINVFAPLSPGDVLQIAKLMVAKHARQLVRDGITLEVTPAALEELAQAGYDPQFGARPLRRVIQERLANTLANLKISNQFQRGDKVVFDAGGKVQVLSGRPGSVK